ncbi:3'-5' exonuclease [Gracilimonas sp. Q87]|uniref:3'-5' exonuclease n=1 Tax=Gracilimonas sp. Q87 TaxID=3384766 RepID=UPI003983F612
MNNEKSLLFGQDDEENIVSIERMSDREYVEIFTRDGNEVNSRRIRTPLFGFVNSRQDALRKLSKDDARVTPLMGDLHYDRMIETYNTKLLYNLKYNADRVEIPTMYHQYFIQSGKTLFKGMGFEDHRALVFDIETITTDGYDFPNALRDGDEVVVIAMYDSTGWWRVIHGVDYSEEEILREFINEVQRRDPDVIVGHNVFNFDLPYVDDRCKKYGIELALGRNGSTPYTYDTSMRLADKDRAYTNYSIYGRHVVDTELLARQADVVKRKYENYGLKYLAKELDVATESRTYVEGSEISDTWKTDPYKIIAYALDDGLETMGLYKGFGQSAFYSTQFIPMGYQDVFRLGSGGKINNLFMRYYMMNGHSIPYPDNERSITGGYADVFKYGFFDQHLVYADVASLYPSLATYLKIQPQSDILKLYKRLVLLLKALRYEVKAKAKDTGKEMYKSQDGAFKILLNTLSYGYLSWNRGFFNDYEEAERITEGGQEILKEMIDQTKEWGGVPIKCDTDGMLTSVPQLFEDADEYCKTLSETFDDLIAIDNDGEYERGIIIDKKSYALVEKGEVEPKIKGQTIRGRNIEPFGRELIIKIINITVGNTEDVAKTTEQKIQRIKEEYDAYRESIINKTIDPEMIKSVGNIKEDLDDYLHRVEMGAGNGGRNADAPYELALESDRQYEVGDTIIYYVKEPPRVWMSFRNKKKKRKIKLKKYESANFLAEYDNDLDPEYYLDRLDSCVKKFLPVFGEDLCEQLNIKIYSKDQEKVDRYAY